jgi:hypothetical protein
MTNQLIAVEHRSTREREREMFIWNRVTTRTVWTSTVSDDERRCVHLSALLMFVIKRKRIWKTKEKEKTTTKVKRRKKKQEEEKKK